jgi:hypothetical protein
MLTQIADLFLSPFSYSFYLSWYFFTVFRFLVFVSY